ncbi:Hypothetical predicted protein [Lecanosticta acicola]|uniref:P-loop containing nucleoside triphosphate hydrolase protein n=1 Tax=Lecanosticta acicola TaxID=111012 RepID=A0AAI8YPA4_9PEZI|nr:Hypothetical predicted protein [Lecanosticta acicola]
MHPIFQSLLCYIYPITPPQKHRTAPLKLLCLGLSRSGTDSLRQALLQLDYKKIYHGYVWLAQPADASQWIHLAHLQITHQPISASEFDSVLGDCDAITDIPPAGFAPELLDAYPDAKVIVNYREDVDAWAESCENTIERITSPKDWSGWWQYFQSFFEARLFWSYRTYWWVWSRFSAGDFPRHGKEWYREHYRNLEEKLKRDGRKYLKWRVQDGWAPLCEFLGKEIPSGEFPNGNVPANFFEKVMEEKEERWRQARRNMVLFGTVVVALVGGLWSWVYQSL